MNNLIDITKSCSHPKPLPDILQWLNITKSMLTGDNHQRQIKQLCSQGISETTYHKLIPHLQDQDGAMKTCKILNGQLASPKTPDEDEESDIEEEDLEGEDLDLEEPIPETTATTPGCYQVHATTRDKC